VWGSWVIVTHSSGVSRGIHHKSALMYIGLWKYTWLHDEIFFDSSLAFACLITCMLFFYFCDDHQFIDEQIREEIMVNREEMNPLHSLPGLDFLCWLGFSFRTMAYVLSGLWASFFENFVVISLCFILTSWYALITVRGCDSILGLLNWGVK